MKKKLLLLAAIGLVAYVQQGFAVRRTGELTDLGEFGIWCVGDVGKCGGGD